MENPGYASKVTFTAAQLRVSIEPLVCARTIPADLVDSMVDELPVYLLACVNTDYAEKNLEEEHEAIVEFWANRRVILPSWYEFYSCCLLLQPSSAASERVFSRLKNVYGENQTRALNDVVEVGCMLQTNGRTIV